MKKKKQKVIKQRRRKPTNAQIKTRNRRRLEERNRLRNEYIRELEEQKKAEEARMAATVTETIEDGEKDAEDTVQG